LDWLCGFPAPLGSRKASVTRSFICSNPEPNLNEIRRMLADRLRPGPAGFQFLQRDIGNGGTFLDPDPILLADRVGKHVPWIRGKRSGICRDRDASDGRRPRSHRGGKANLLPLLPLLDGFRSIGAVSRGISRQRPVHSPRNGACSWTTVFILSLDYPAPGQRCSRRY